MQFGIRGKITLLAVALVTVTALAIVVPSAISHRSENEALVRDATKRIGATYARQLDSALTSLARDAARLAAAPAVLRTLRSTRQDDPLESSEALDDASRQLVSWLDDRPALDAVAVVDTAKLDREWIRVEVQNEGDADQQDVPTLRATIVPPLRLSADLTKNLERHASAEVREPTWFLVSAYENAGEHESPHILVAAPVDTDDGPPLGAILLTLNAERLLHEIVGPSGNDVPLALISGASGLLAATDLPFADAELKNVLAASPAETASSSGSVVRSADGTRFVVYRADISPTTGSSTLAVVHTSPPLPDVGLVQSLDAMTQALIAALILGAAGVAFYVARRIALPLERITQAAANFGAAPTPATSVGEGGDEIGRLAQSFHAMTLQMQQRDEAQRRESAARLSAVVDTAAEGIITIDQYGRIELFNRAASEIFGYASDEVIGQNVNILMPSPESEEHDAHLGRYRRTHQAHILGSRREVTGRRRDGSTFPMELAVSELRLETERKFTGVFRDITRRKADLAEMRRVNEELQAARDAAVEASRSKSSFLANMSHELRTPLNAIIGYSEMIEEDAADSGADETAGDARRIREAGSHLLSLINEILDLSKIEAGKMELFVEEFAVADLLNEVESMVTPQVEKRKNAFRIDAPDDLGHMTADVTKIRQALSNLLSNAAKFTENGTITLAVRRFSAPHHEKDDAPWFRFQVQDTGIGIDAEKLPHLFQEFTQADASTTRKYGGTGLGLSITRRFARMMGGDVTVESAVGSGSTFTLEIPADVQTPVSASPPPSRGDDPAQPESDESVENQER